MVSSSSSVKVLFSQSSHYLMGMALVTFMHLFTFPIFTRIFTVSDYGLLSLVSVTISVIFVISKFGFTSSSVRFFEDCRTHNGIFTLNNYYSTYFFAAIGTGFIAMMLVSLIAYIIQYTNFDSTFTNLLFFVSIIVFLRTIVVILMSFLRAEQKTRAYNLIDIITTYAGCACSILLSLFLIKGLYGFYSGQIIIFLSAGILLFRWFSRSHHFHIKYFSGILFKESILFGLPMVGLELLNHILAFGDRLFIKLFCDSYALGIYSVGYNLSSYISDIMLVPLSFVITPLIMKSWINDGSDATKYFLSRSVRYIMLAFCPIIAGFNAVDKELITLAASAKYVSAENIIPYASIGIGFLSISQIFNAGLIIYKRTDKILIYCFIATIINTLLNIVLIPKFNIVGAAVATLISYALYFVFITISSFSFLSFEIPFRKIILYFTMSLLMFFLTNQIYLHNVIITLVAKIIFGASIYSLLVLLFDKELQKQCRKIIKSRLIGVNDRDE